MSVRVANTLFVATLASKLSTHPKTMSTILPSLPPRVREETLIDIDLFFPERSDLTCCHAIIRFVVFSYSLAFHSFLHTVRNAVQEVSPVVYGGDVVGVSFKFNVWINAIESVNCCTRLRHTSLLWPEEQSVWRSACQTTDNKIGGGMAVEPNLFMLAISTLS